MKDDNSTDYTAPPYSLSNGYVSLLTNATVKALFGPAGDHTGLNSGNYGGLGYIEYGTAGAALRGSYWNSGLNAGVFALNLNRAPSYSITVVGFRCARQ